MANASLNRDSHSAHGNGSPVSAREHGKAHGAASKKQVSTGPLSARQLELMNAYFRACNYLSVGMIYLQDNPLLRRPLEVEHIKQRLLGHWGASPALSFTWLHLNRLIVE